MEERTEIESLKWRVTAIENILVNFEGISKDADGALVFGRKAPLPSPSEPEEGV